MNRSWQRGTVLPGKRQGRTIGFPTINLSPDKIEGKMRIGVYACLVRIKEKTYPGVLFYGPRLIKKERHPVLEIHIMDFKDNLYGKTIDFQPLSYIRKVRNFTTMAQMRRAIAEDVKKARKHTP